MNQEEADQDVAGEVSEEVDSRGKVMRRYWYKHDQASSATYSKMTGNSLTSFLTSVYVTCSLTQNVNCHFSFFAETSVYYCLHNSDVNTGTQRTTSNSKQWSLGLMTHNNSSDLWVHGCGTSSS